jgi:GNAT superfamily N-acetyltransferase
VVLVDETVTHLEMTDPRQLRPGRPAPSVRLEPADATSALLRPIMQRVAAPHRWSSLRWTDEQWDGWLHHTRRRRWLIRHGTAVAGLAEVEAHPDGEVEITTFGLAPEFVGRGLGGHALTIVVRLAWVPWPDGPVRRVWLHTSSFDHPNALPNYRNRGFRPFHIEVRDREIEP